VKAQLGATRSRDGVDLMPCIKAPFDVANALISLNEEGTKLLPSAD
jgi:hypothetical protein